MNYSDASREPQTEHVIRFPDCDPLGHLNNARYLDYFLNAREDHLREYYDMDIYKYSHERGEGWVVSRSLNAYLVPALLMERVQIRTRVIEPEERRVTVEALMLDQGGERLKALSRLEFSYVNLKSGRLSKHPSDIMEMIQALNTLPGPMGDFESRLKDVKKEIRADRKQGVPA